MYLSFVLTFFNINSIGFNSLFLTCVCVVVKKPDYLPCLPFLYNNLFMETDAIVMLSELN